MTLRSSERDAPAVRPDPTSALSAAPPRIVTVDYEAYAHLLDDADLSEDDKRQLLQALWSIICSFVQLGYGVQPAQQACGKLFDASPKSPSAAPDMVSCSVDNNDIADTRKEAQP